MIRELNASDFEEMCTFLEAHVETSMFLLNNAHRSGLVYDGDRYTGNYVGLWTHEKLIGVCAHYWNGMMIAHCEPTDYDALWRAAQALSGRSIDGVVGPIFQATAIKADHDRDIQFHDEEVLYALALEQIIVPTIGSENEIVLVPVDDSNIDIAAAWRLEYDIESFGRPRTEKLKEVTMTIVKRAAQDGLIWLLRDGVDYVAMSAFNAALDHTVQIGGVYTPLELRGRGYGRAVVGLSLVEARSNGVSRAILFTGEENIPAQKAYVALGFEPIGTFSILVFKDQA